MAAAILILLIGPLVIVPLGVGLLLLRYIEDGLEWVAPRQCHPLE